MVNLYSQPLHYCTDMYGLLAIHFNLPDEENGEITLNKHRERGERVSYYTVNQIGRV